MSEISVIGPIPEESENLRLHVDLCAQRYDQLINKFDEVDQRLDHITAVCEEIKNTIQGNTKDTYQQYLAWAGVLIVGLAGLVVTLVLR